MLTTISLITTVYNRDRYLAQTLDSILAQTYPHFELLIWDDGSTDNSIDIAHDYAQRDDRIRVMQSPHNQGFPQSIKAAIAATTAPYFGWVDSDDLLAPTALAETVAALDAHPDIGLVYTNHLLIDEQGNDRGLGRQCRIPYSKDRLLVDFMVFHFRLIRRSCYEEVGGIDPTISCAEDYDLCLKLSEVTEIHHLPKPLYRYRRHDHNVTNNQVEVIRSAQQAIQNALERRGLNQAYELKITPTFSLRSKPTITPASTLPKIAPVSLNPLVSIVIPAYNAAPHLQRCLRSCLAQHYDNLEIILVDNGSTDNTIKIAQMVAQSANRPFHMLQCSERGANQARTLGMDSAQGDFIQWLDADDELAPDKILLQVLALTQQPEYDIAYGDWHWWFWQNDDCFARLRFVDRPYRDFLLESLLDNWRPPHSYLLRRRAALRLQQLNAWNPETTVYMDREYFTLAVLLNDRFLYVPGSEVRYHRWALTQVSRQATYLDRVINRKRLFRRFQDVGMLSQAEKLTAQHQFLLQQSWELWQPTFTLVEEGGFRLFQTEQPEPFEITWQQANLARALLKAPTPRTLEDYAREVMQVLWQEILVELTQAGVMLEYDLIVDKLAWRIGSKTTNAAIQAVPEVSSLEVSLHPLLTQVPLFTPLLSEERFVVQQFLDQLRRDRCLQPVPL
ncbi:glycosyltransferase family 2 protein [Leptolyngbya sp. NIES-2104]|uniref:glycosyltransferase family 2 protein n=1 Tax=Leptolyngbya sp. NIES-2104 TaxID=1552121 RepID=UPI0006EC7E58|nr:glycosyltransferase [Leptolyngbya sp. NIES-2104]GAQ00080.1 glycosyl transferase, group 2 family protein [Leptolyngbya sp. NIES-2104]